VDYDEADYEVELAIVIGRQCKNVTLSEAADYILGYAVANDVTARKHQEKTSQWSYAKGMVRRHSQSLYPIFSGTDLYQDGFCPLGPCIVSTEQVPDASVLNLQTSLNGKIMQNGSADDMIFSIPEIVSYVSQVQTLCKVSKDTS
jgi:2-keto-4-pentenoate hydratase/2-oxohepta-3-ene-1,7-dioic acid hydratase in catechol pathway